MQPDFRKYEMPAKFAARFQPVRSHPHEKGLAAFVLDDYGLGFFRRMATGADIPDQAVWSVVHRASAPAIILVAGRSDEALGHVVCQIPQSSGEPTMYPVTRRLSYRAKVTIAALQALVRDLAAEGTMPADAEVFRIIERRIERIGA